MAFAHIGWRSMALQFTRKVLHHLHTRHQTQLADCLAVIGPCIKKESYLFSNPVQAQNPIWQPYLIPHADGRMGIDLVGFCQAECLALGLLPHQIFTEAMDTASHPDQFSHYMGTEGRQPHKQGRLICYGFLE
jgi:copper oxidase (laccase) domain-containing protein